MSLNTGGNTLNNVSRQLNKIHNKGLVVFYVFQCGNVTFISFNRQLHNMCICEMTKIGGEKIHYIKYKI